MDKIERHKKIQRMIESLGIEWDGDLNYALYKLHEVDRIMGQVVKLVADLYQEVEKKRPDLDVITDSLVRIKLQIYEALPGHVSELEEPLSRMFDRLCDVEPPAAD